MRNRSPKASFSTAFLKLRELMVPGLKQDTRLFSAHNVFVSVSRGITIVANPDVWTSHETFRKLLHGTDVPNSSFPHALLVSPEFRKFLHFEHVSGGRSFSSIVETFWSTLNPPTQNAVL
jgi:hypothetical protein